MKMSLKFKWELVPLLYILFCATSLYGATSSEVLIPWGSTPGTLKEAIFTEDVRQEWRGPSSFRINTDGSIYILNTLGSTVERFSSSGKHEVTYAFPAFTENDEETVGLDFTITSAGEVCVLEESERKIIVFNSSGTIKKTISIPNLPSSVLLLSYLDSDDHGNFYIFNDYDNLVYVTDSAGSLLVSCKSLSGANYLVDSKGHLISVVEKDDESQLPEPSEKTAGDEPSRNAEYQIVSVNPLTGLKKVAGTYKYKPSTAAVSPVGILSDGSVCVEMVNGIVEKVDAHKVLVFSDKGMMKNIFTVSRPSAVLQMIRSRAVTPEGKIACTRVTKKGLVIRYYPRH
jgi:hypothetical protein